MTGDFAIAMCDGKKEFATYWQAQRAATRLNRKQDGAKGNAYRCPAGRHFHVGNTLGKMKKRRPNRHTLKELAKHGRKKFSI